MLFQLNQISLTLIKMTMKW